MLLQCMLPPPPFARDSYVHTLHIRHVGSLPRLAAEKKEETRWVLDHATYFTFLPFFPDY